MDNSVAKAVQREKNFDCVDLGTDFGWLNGMGTHFIQQRRLQDSYKRPTWMFLSFWIAFMFDVFYIIPNSEKMGTKIGYVISGWIAGCFGFTYTLLNIDWESWKAGVLLVTGAVWSLANALRALVKLYREYHDARKHVKDINKPAR